TEDVDFDDDESFDDEDESFDDEDESYDDEDESYDGTDYEDAEETLFNIKISGEFKFSWNKEKFSTFRDPAGTLRSWYEWRRVYEAGTIQHELGLACVEDEIRIVSHPDTKKIHKGGREIDFKTSAPISRIPKWNRTREDFRKWAQRKEEKYGGERYLYFSPTADFPREAEDTILWTVGGVGGASLDPSTVVELELAMKAALKSIKKLGVIGKALKVTLKVLDWLEVRVPSKVVSSKGAYTINAAFRCTDGEVKLKSLDTSFHDEKPVFTVSMTASQNPLPTAASEDVR
ncbi:MAG: hypothetical protein CL928_08110, partial [Deltaproteobacteria bacterium]|nr:hypothetical protein [Deltaproteobacteria bacterium]